MARHWERHWRSTVSERDGLGISRSNAGSPGAENIQGFRVLHVGDHSQRARLRARRYRQSAFPRSPGIQA